MNILSVLLANVMLISGLAPGFIKSQTNKTTLFAANANEEKKEMLPHIEVAFDIQDYEYIKQETDISSIIDYIIKSKKINIDKILEDPSVSIKLEEILPESISGSALERAKEKITKVIATNIAVQLNEKYKKEVEAIVKKKKKRYTPPLSILNWLLTIEGTKATLEWFNREYGEKTSDTMPVHGQGKWEATLDFTSKALAFVKSKDAELTKLLAEWETLAGDSDYAAKLASFIAKSDLTEVAQKTLWSANDDVADYLEEYNKWRISTAPGKGQEVLRTEWETKDDYEEKAKAHIKATDAELTKLLAEWEKLHIAGKSDYNAKKDAFIAKSDLTDQAQKALWSANADVADYLEEYNKWRISTAPGKGQEVLRTEWETKDDYTDKAKAHIKATDAELTKLLAEWEKLHIAGKSDYNAKKDAFIAKSDLTDQAQKALWSANADVADYLEEYNKWRISTAPGKGQEVLRTEWETKDDYTDKAKAHIKATDAELTKLLAKWETLAVNGKSDYNAKKDAFIAKSDLTDGAQKALWSANADVAHFLESYNTWRKGNGDSSLKAAWKTQADYTTKAKTYIKNSDPELIKLLTEWKKLAVNGKSDYNAKKNAFINNPALSAADKKALWSTNADVAHYLEAYNTWRKDAAKGKVVLRPLWEATTTGADDYTSAFGSWKTSKGRRDHEWKVATGADGGVTKLNDFITDAANKDDIFAAWKTDTSTDGFDKKADAWITKLNSGTTPKSKDEWFWSDDFRKKANTWISGLTSTSVGVSNDSLVKSAWYFSPDYLAKSASNKHSNKTNAGLDTWIDNNQAVGAEAIRHFVANNPSHEISKVFFDFWKNNDNANYTTAQNAWTSNINTDGGGVTRVKPDKATWLAQGHGAWDTYKLWAEGEAKKDNAVVNAVTNALLPSSTLTKADYKAAGTSLGDFQLWWAKLNAEQQNIIILKGFKATSNYGPDKSSWKNDIQKELSWDPSDTDFRKNLKNKMEASDTLYNFFKAYRDLKYTVTSPSQLYIAELGSDSTKDIAKVVDDLVKDVTSTSIGLNIKTAAIAFKDSYVKDYEQDNAFPVTYSKWKEKWYDLSKSDLKWDDWDSRFYWIAEDNATAQSKMTSYAKSTYSSDADRLTLFNNSPYGKTWDLNNPSPVAGAKKAHIDAQFNAGASWVLLGAMNDTTKGRVPGEFTIWKGKFKPVFTQRDKFKKYGEGLGNADQKAVGWDDFIATAFGLGKYDDWKKAQTVTDNALTAEILAKYATYKSYYNSNAESNKDYNAWNPWYIAGDQEFEAYARKGLELESGKFDFVSPYYLRYIYSKHKEHKLFKNVSGDEYLMEHMDDVPSVAVYKAMNWSKSNIPYDKFSEINTLAAANPFAPAS